MEQTIQPKTLGAFVRSISGLFITKANPNGITPKECAVLGALIYVMNSRQVEEIDKDVREDLANLTNHSLQVTINYINKFKKKGLIVDNKLNSLLTATKIVIHGTSNV